jgi:hypothetical protein
MADTATTGTSTGTTTDTGTTATTTGSTDTGTTATGTADTATSDTGTATGTDTDWQAQAEKWRTLSRKHETAAKANADAAKKLADIEDAQKTETQKLSDRLAAAEKELGEHRIRDIRMKAAREAGLDADMADFLTATEPDAALAQAKVLAKKVQPAKPDLKQGARTTAKPSEDMNAWLRRKAGYDTTP